MDKKKETVSRRGLIELGTVRCLPFCVLYISQSFQNKLKWQNFYPKKENQLEFSNKIFLFVLVSAAKKLFFFQGISSEKLTRMSVNTLGKDSLGQKKDTEQKRNLFISVTSYFHSIHGLKIGLITVQQTNGFLPSCPTLMYMTHK